MAQERTRRDVLRILGVGSIVSFAGCASEVGNPGSTATPSDESEGVDGSSWTTTRPGGESNENDGTGDGESDDDESESDDSEDDEPEPVQVPSGVVRTASVPTDPGSFQYATMGSADAPVTARVYGAWKCPYTEDFVKGYMQDVVKQYVEPGKLALQFRAVAYDEGEPFHGPDEVRAARAGLAVWNESPESYWSYFAHMFENRSGLDGWATTDTILRIAEKAGVSNLGVIEKAIESGAYRKQVDETMDQVHEIPVNAVPRVVVSEIPTAPTAFPGRTKRQLETAIDPDVDSFQPRNSTASNGADSSQLSNSTATTTISNSTTSSN